MDNQKSIENSVKNKHYLLICSLMFNVLIILISLGLVIYTVQLKDDLLTSKAQLSEEIAKSKQLENETATLRSELANLDVTASQLRSDLTATQSNLVAILSKKPHVPVRVSFRRSLLGRGLVGIFENTSDKYLSVIIELTNPTLKRTKRITLNLNPGVKQEIGHGEGWPFASGDVISLYHNDYDTNKKVVP